MLLAHTAGLLKRDAHGLFDQLGDVGNDGLKQMEQVKVHLVELHSGLRFFGFKFFVLFDVVLNGKKQSVSYVFESLHVSVDARHTSVDLAQTVHHKVFLLSLQDLQNLAGIAEVLLLILGLSFFQLPKFLVVRPEVG